ncbi:uncharacterized protein [Halyomorpha halys]|uniref:uncharacterized protein n=1 Tax=Halyomorpha halys TaxID=286706 RepID=UPI0006D4EE4D|nr:uncharacterized protein LOC106687036 [Halyomorpha halys]XP_014286182.1 uncharacterized protein LOC106687036 [Halyomorpha halys]
MQNFKLVFLILLNTPHWLPEAEAGTIWISNNFQMAHIQKKILPRLKRTVDPSLAVEILLRDKESTMLKTAGDSYLSEAMEHMDAPSLLKLLGKLKEEYVAKAEKDDTEEVRSSFDKLMETLVTMSNSPRRPKSGPAEILSQLSEEELEDEIVMYDGDFYSDEEYSEEEESSNPSLLALQSWNQKISGVWDW